MVHRKSYRDVTCELAMFRVQYQSIKYDCGCIPVDDEPVEWCVEEKEQPVDEVFQTGRQKRANKKRKVKCLLKTKSLGSCLKKLMYDNNGNLNGNTAQLSYAVFHHKQTSYLNKGKSRLHVKYNIYNKFNLATLEDTFVNPIKRCKHVFSDAYMLKHPSPKQQKTNTVVKAPIPVSTLPPPPPRPVDSSQAVIEIYEIPKYVYILDDVFRKSQVLPNYTQHIKSDCAYAYFEKKSSTVLTEVASAVSLPLFTLGRILKANPAVCKHIVESSTIVKHLLKLLTLLNGHTVRGAHQLITKEDMIELPVVASTGNYHSKGTGFGTGSLNSVWSIKCTHWKHTTEKEHNLLVFKILDCLFEEVDLKLVVDSSSVVNLFLEFNLLGIIDAYLKNNSILDISESLELYKAIVSFTYRLTSMPSVKEAMVKARTSDAIVNMINIMNLYLSKIKDDQLLSLNRKLQKIADVFETRKVEEIAKMATKSATKDHEKYYCEKMRHYLFDTFKMIDEDGKSNIVPYHFSSLISSMCSNLNRVKRIAQEIVSLSNSLPLSASSSVFVRCDEELVDVMKVLITGPEDTPYSMGCFEFDVSFPNNYPIAPPKIVLKTTGNARVRFNPNLYNCGKVCLSILGTWPGRPEEQWNEMTSTLLQVLVSIQSLILVPEPYFNEPGFQYHFNTPHGNDASRRYNAVIIEATMKWAILEMIKNPPKPFQDVIFEHFYLRTNELKKQVDKWRFFLLSYYRDQEALMKNFESYASELNSELKKLKQLKEEEKVERVGNSSDVQSSQEDMTKRDDCVVKREEEENGTSQMISTIDI